MFETVTVTCPFMSEKTCKKCYFMSEEVSLTDSLMSERHRFYIFSNFSKSAFFSNDRRKNKTVITVEKPLQLEQTKA